MARNIKYLEADLKKFIESIVTKEMKLEWAELVADTIYKRTKSGKGLTNNKVSVGGNGLTKLKALSNSYIDQRLGKIGFFTIGKGPGRKVVPYTPTSAPILGPFGSPRKSNLTFSGELLESIAARVSGNKTLVEIQGGKHSNSDIDMKELAQLVSDNGRPFFGLSDSEAKTLENYVKRKIRDKIRSLIKR